MSDLEDLGDVDEFEKPAPRLSDDVKSIIRNYVADKIIDVTSDTYFYAMQLGELKEYLEEMGIDINDDDATIEAVESITIGMIRDITNEYAGE